MKKTPFDIRCRIELMREYGAHLGEPAAIKQIRSLNDDQVIDRYMGITPDFVFEVDLRDELIRSKSPIDLLETFAASFQHW